MSASPHQTSAARARRHGFTLVELLLSITILAVLMLLIVQVISQTSNVWQSTTAKADQFREARDAFESIARNISQATLNTYYDYYNAEGQSRSQVSPFDTFVPHRYGRYSELRFQSGQASNLVNGSNSTFPTHGIFFQAPLGFSNQASNTGLNNLLNTWGYYLEFRADTDRPSFVPGATRRRFRLMEFMQPSEELSIYSSPANWIEQAQGGTKSHVVASNIIALLILPKLPSTGKANDPSVDVDGNKLAPNYAYNSREVGQGQVSPELNSLHQLPPVVEITMVAIDERSAARLEEQNGSSPPNFGLSSMFQNASPTQRLGELEALKGSLDAQRISYRVFSTEVSIRGAKWSREQTVASGTP